jgi:hypothetical protein
MTVVQLAIQDMGLTRENTDAVVELLCDAIILVPSCVVWAYKGRVVRTNLSNIGVLSIAEFGVVVAWLSV